MASSKWKTWDELEALIRGKRVVFWGASNWVERMLERLPVPEERGVVVDNNPNNHGIRYCGFDVLPPRWLLDQDRDEIYIVICTVNYPSVITELDEMRFTMGEQFCCNPLLNEHQPKDELKSLARKVLVSSPEHARTDTTGGGIYEVDTAHGDTRKLYSGKCRGISYMGDDLLVIDMLRGLVVLDPDFKNEQVFELPQHAEPHGVHYDASSHCVFVGQPGRDSIGVYDMSDGKLARELFLSDKWKRNKKDNHHINDCWVAPDDTLYVSVFSFSGNWLHDVYDGGVLELDKLTGEIRGPAVSGIWMPHSVAMFEGKLCYIDSMRGELYDSSWNALGKFPGFMRGLDYDGRYFFIGSTEHRYPEKLKGVSLNISLDTGFVIFDAETKMSRFCPLPQTEAVHSLTLRRAGGQPVK